MSSPHSISTNLLKFLPHPPTTHTLDRRDARANFKHQKIVGGPQAAELSPETFFFVFFALPSSVDPNVSGELFCHDSPVRAALSAPAATLCHFLGSTSDEEELPLAARNRNASTPKAARQSVLHQHLANETHCNY